MNAPLGDPEAGDRRGPAGPATEDEATGDTAMLELIAVMELLDRAGREMGRPGGGPGAPDALGDFSIVRVIGRGGMGVVYEAVQRSLGRRVALKILPAAPDDPRKLQRFRVEAMAAACLRHPHIVPVYLTGSEGDCHFYAMQLIEGRTLAAVAASRPPHREAAELGRQAALALQYAHEQGVVHRDVKPSNLLVDESGWLWVGDFGLARMAGQSDLTQSGAILGTLRYMSPEQAAGARSVVDHRTDVYSLGATLYELIAGRPVFEADGDSRLGLLRQVADGQPRRPRLIDPSVPRDLETIVLKALSKDPAGRYATAGEMAEDLGRFLEGRPILARPPGPLDLAARWARRNRWAVAAGLAAVLAAILAAGGLVVWRDGMLRGHNRELKEALSRAERNEQSTRRLLYDSQMRLAQQAHASGQAELAQEILSGLAPGADGLDLRGFEWRHLDRASRRDVSVLADHEATAMLAAPGGRLLASGGGDGSLLLYDPAAGREVARVPAHPGEVSGLALSPDGRVLASWMNGGDGPGEARLWDAADGRALATFPRAGAAVEGVAFSADGRTIAVQERGMKGDRSRNAARFWILAGGAVRPSPAIAPIPCDRMAYSPDGRWMATAGLDGPVVTLRDAATGRPEATLMHRQPEVGGLAFSPDGRTLASFSWMITFWDVPSRRELGSLPIPMLKHGEFSADGGRFAGDPVLGSDAVLIADIRKAPRRIPLEGILGEGLSVALSPDGRQLACGGIKQGAAIWDAGTGRKRAAYPAGAGTVRCLAFTADGGSLVFKAADGRLRAWHLGRSSESFTRIAAHRAEVWGLAFSPDGSTLATSADDHTIGLWDAREGSRTAVLKGHGALVAGVAISPDGHTLASAGFENKVRLWDLPAGRPRAVLSGHTDRVRAVAISPDGRLVASAGSDGTVRLWDAAHGRPMAEFSGHTDTVRALAFAPAGPLLASSGNDRTIRVVELPGGREVASLRSPRQVGSLAFSSDGALLAVGDDWGNLSIWDAAAWSRRRLVKGSDAAVWGLAFSPDGRTLAAACGDAKVRLWDPATGQMTLVLDGHAKRVNAVAFSPDGRTLASASHDGSVILWRGSRDDPR
ncbi:Serine/threonine-protein kinase PrkC [Aquisphaera giovannonii]|uniref:Serine/threonine-protein kinase PrkC n=1 Tax=Aquisphaera giovannonii TaxID=406548 RepID=A0A5B9VWR3_9BACT|nr:protein kinase [Aquisphaera giovannonii]QEH32311.1 Serine/threonine-protein kinase PrkC [Aquisphaera giovannonii]